MGSSGHSGHGANSERRTVRREKSKPLVLELKVWLEQQITRVSGFTASFRLDIRGLYNSGIRPDLLVEERGKLRRRASHRIDEVNLRELGPYGRIVQDRYQVLRYPVGDRGINLGVANRPYQTVMLTPLRSG